LGTIESWLVLIKIVAVALFVGLAVLIVFGLTGEPAIGLRNLTGQGGFMPFGIRGV
jgi:amino acid transporter, AAT family